MTHEADYQRIGDVPQQPTYLNGTNIEIVRPGAEAESVASSAQPEHVVLDFDGTLSLIREGWPDVMVPMMVDVLQGTGTDAAPEQLHDVAMRFVMELNGKQTIYQMIRLAEEVRSRGGEPDDPVQYKRRYHDLLMQRIESRRDAIRQGVDSPRDHLVPCSIELLESIQQRGATLYLASGTDEQYVVEEVELLGLTRFFGQHIYGARDDYRSFSKAMVIQRILRENQVEGDRLLGFGDGYVEIQNIRESGGTAVAVASDESGRSGEPDSWKRDRLIGAGADLVVPDYRDHAALIDYLWG